MAEQTIALLHPFRRLRTRFHKHDGVHDDPLCDDLLAKTAWLEVSLEALKAQAPSAALV